MSDVASHDHFVTLFGAAPGSTGSARGRVNLIGEHTDYHEGFVLPTLLPQGTVVRLRLRRDAVVRASSALSSGLSEYVVGLEARGRGWLDYVQGVTAVLTRRGLHTGGFDVAIDSTLPVGGGVSSSAALCVSLLRALREACAFDIDDLDVARLAQRAEVEFVGAPIGIMDQLACSLGRPREALFIDTRTLAVESIALPTSIELVVIDSGIAHAHAEGAYATRRRESFEAAAALEVRWLRDASADLLIERSLPDLLARRARHVITENARVLEAAAALRTGDVTRLGMLLDQSHASMRDDFEITTPEIDVLVGIGQSDPDINGARLTGGGFGGSVVMLARAGAARQAAERIASLYRARTDRVGTVLVPTPHPVVGIEECQP